LPYRNVNGLTAAILGASEKSEFVHEGQDADKVLTKLKVKILARRGGYAVADVTPAK
jgi:hypothetical protein